MSEMSQSQAARFEALSPSAKSNYAAVVKRVEELTAENERLREALRPFADIYNDYRFLSHTVDMKHMRQDTMRHHYKQAAEALEGSSEH